MNSHKRKNFKYCISSDSGRVSNKRPTIELRSELAFPSNKRLLLLSAAPQNTALIRILNII